MQLQRQVEAVYTVPVTISATGVIAHTLNYVLKRLDLTDLLYVTIQRHVIVITFKHRKFLSDSAI